MTTFVLICATMCSAALAFIIRPLTGAPGLNAQRRTIVILALGLPLTATLLYLKIGDPAAIDAAPTRETTAGPPTAVMQIIERARSEPDNVEAQLDAAAVYYQVQRYDEAIAYLNKANQLRPDDPVVLEMYWRVLVQQGNNTEAERVLKQLETLDPNNPDLPHNP
jgi:cytochrome c-type biogenesis protein CcmH